MVIWRLVLNNFQGIRSLAVDLRGKSASFYGDNGTGKTTVYNALTWLLFDKASNGAKGFTPKTRDKNGEVHNLEHSVEGEFETDDGRRVVLKKTFREVYKKKRGTAREEFSGHSVDYAIDGVPVKEKEFSERVLEFCGGDEKRIRVLTMPDCFAEQLPWEERRKILLELVGNCSEEDVVAENEELEDLLDILKMPGAADRRYTVDEYRSIATARKADINKQLQEIPARIDESTRMVSDAGETNLSELEEAIRRADAEYTALVNQKSLLMCSGATEVEKSIQESRMKLATALTEFNEANADKYREASGEITALRREHAKMVGESTELEGELKALRSELARKTELRKELVEQYRTVSATKWDEKKNVCPTCGRSFPAQKVDEMRTAFEDNRDATLMEINRRGKAEASKEVIEKIVARIAEIEKRIADLGARAESTLQSINTLEATLEKKPSFETTDAYKTITAEISELEKKRESDGKSLSESIGKLEDEMKQIRERRDGLEKKKAAVAMADSAKKRVEELEKQEKDLGAVYEDIERGLYLCEVYTKTMVNMLTEKINERFKNVRFRLFQSQINGGIKEDCEVMVPSAEGNLIPYGMANNAARLNAGLEIIDTLSDFWGIRMPVVLDNAEAVTHPYEMRAGQFIRLIVSEADKKLRVDVE